MRGKKYLDKEEGERGKEVKGADKMERKTKNKKTFREIYQALPILSDEPHEPHVPFRAISFKTALDKLHRRVNDI